MKTAIFRLTIVLTLMIALQACGNKGDLYLPDKNTEETSQKP